MSKPAPIKEVFICDCRSKDHIMVVHYEPYEELWEDVVSLYVTLTTGNFWWRIKTALKYIFKGNEGYPFDDILLSTNDVARLRGILDQILEWENEKANKKVLNKLAIELADKQNDPFGKPVGKEII